MYNNGLYMGSQTRGNGTYIFGTREEWIAFMKLFVLNHLLSITFFNLFTSLERKDVESGSNSVHASYGDCTSQFPFISYYQDITS
jgi:hypothetical protein